MGQTSSNRWNLVPVPLATIRASYPNYDDREAVYYIVSGEKEINGCPSKYLSGAYDCGSDHNARRVQLWHNKDEQGVQWWRAVSLPGNGMTVRFENFYIDQVCDIKHKYLGADYETAVRYYDLNYAGLNYGWTIGQSGGSPIQNSYGWNYYPDSTIPCNVQNGCMTTGFGCDLNALPGQCSFPRERAIELCAKNSSCEAVTCQVGRNDCQARQSVRDEGRPYAGIRNHPEAVASAGSFSYTPPYKGLKLCTEMKSGYYYKRSCTSGYLDAYEVPHYGPVLDYPFSCGELVAGAPNSGQPC